MFVFTLVKLTVKVIVIILEKLIDVGRVGFIFLKVFKFFYVQEPITIMIIDFNCLIKSQWSSGFLGSEHFILNFLDFINQFIFTKNVFGFLRCRFQGSLWLILCCIASSLNNSFFAKDFGSNVCFPILEWLHIYIFLFYIN